ncbi:hypothetical protein ACGFR6_08115 [Streptomyces sp. NPDC048567]|uniref:hypothetical protein n=1 Tax=Streptomyces sp. NPDC048567 TaxID=3365570 RepID=UPI00371BB3D0
MTAVIAGWKPTRSDDVLVLRRTWSVAAGVLLIVALHLIATETAMGWLAHQISG